jgi:hypothetical protein
MAFPPVKWILHRVYGINVIAAGCYAWGEADATWMAIRLPAAAGTA